MGEEVTITVSDLDYLNYIALRTLEKEINNTK